MPAFLPGRIAGHRELTGVQGGLPIGIALRAVMVLTVVAFLGGCPAPEPGAQASTGSPATEPRATGVAERPGASRASLPAWPATFRDDLGREVTLDQPARRVVSLAPNLTEIVFFLGQADRLVGVTDFCDYPPDARHKPSIGGIVNPSLEKVLALRPDLVLVARGSDLAFIERLRRDGVQVFGTDPQTLDDVLGLIERLGALLGCADEAAERVADLRAQVAQLASQLPEARPRPRALVVISLDPLFVAGGGTFVDDLLRLAGMDNAAGHDKPWAEWSAERVLAAQPDPVILVGPSSPSPAAKAPLALLAGKTPWRTLPSVKAGRVFEVSEDHLTVPGPRLLQGLADLVAVRSKLSPAPTPGARMPR